MNNVSVQTPYVLLDLAKSLTVTETRYPRVPKRGSQCLRYVLREHWISIAREEANSFDGHGVSELAGDETCRKIGREVAAASSSVNVRPFSLDDLPGTEVRAF